VTLDKRRFYFHQDSEQQWLLLAERPPCQSQSMVSSPKVMLTVVWDTQSFHIVEVHPKEATIDTDYCCQDILSGILKVSGGKT
jgi:hypothetical protein